MRNANKVSTLWGYVQLGGSEAGPLHKLSSGRLWPSVIRQDTPGGTVSIAVDGYLALNDRILLGDCERDIRIVVDNITSDDPTKFLRSIDNGNFNIALHDERNKRTRLISSAEGLLPLHILYTSDKVVFSESVGLFRSLFGDALQLDPVGVAELYWLGYQIGDRTLYKNVMYMPPGAVIDIDWRIGSRKTFTWAVQKSQQGSRNANGDLETLTFMFLDLLGKACRRLQTPERRYGIKLSGGMDSRAILFCWDDNDIIAYNYGATRAYETDVARHTADCFRIPFVTRELKGDFFSAYQRVLLDRYGIAEFFHNSLLEEFSENACDFAIDGFLGDVLFGGLTLKRTRSIGDKIRNVLGLMPQPEKIEGDIERLAEAIFSEIRVSDAPYRVLQPEVHEFLDASIARIKDDIAKYIGEMPQFLRQVEKYTAFMVGNRSRRYIALQGAVCRPTVECLYPYLDAELKELATNIDRNILAGKRFYTNVYRVIAQRSVDLPGVNSLMPAGWPQSLHILGRIIRYNIEKYGYQLALLTDGRVDVGKINCVQWSRWIAFNDPFRQAVREFMSKSQLVDLNRYDAILSQHWRDHGIRGTRYMLTASYCGLYNPGATTGIGGGVNGNEHEKRGFDTASAKS